ADRVGESVEDRDRQDGEDVEHTEAQHRSDVLEPEHHTGHDRDRRNADECSDKELARSHNPGVHDYSAVRAYWQWVGGLLAGAALVAAVTALIWALEPHVPVLSLAVLCLFAVLPVAVFWGLPFAIATSVASMLAFNFYFLPPTHTFTLQDSRNWFALGVFLVTSVVVSELAARSRRRATEAALLAEIAGSLLERGDVSGELERIASEAAGALEVESASIELGPQASPGEPLLAGGRRVGTIRLVNARRGGAAGPRRAPPAPPSLLRVPVPPHPPPPRRPPRAGHP